MERYVLLVVFIYVTFSYAEETKETKEMTFSVPHPESQPNDVLANAPPQRQCPDGGYCSYRQRCCPRDPPGPHRRYGCCDWGTGAVCCDDYQTCCPVFWVCDTPTKECVRPRVNSYSSVLRVPALPLGNDTDKGCRDGKAGMDLKVGRIRLSQQPETALKRIRFIGTSSEVFFPDEKYQCPEGTSICELSSGIYGCCHLIRGRRISKSILP